MNAMFSLVQVVASLAAEDAKIWIDEDEHSSLPSNHLQIYIDYKP